MVKMEKAETQKARKEKAIKEKERRNNVFSSQSQKKVVEMDNRAQGLTEC